MKKYKASFIFILPLFVCGCVSVEEFDFENYETSKAKSVLYEKPIVNKPKKVEVVVPQRMVAKVQKAKQERAQQKLGVYKKKTPQRAPQSFANDTKIEQALAAPVMKFYTPDTVVDSQAQQESQKGAALLVWSKKKEAHFYEVRIYQEQRVEEKNSFISPSQFFHVMVFFDKNYLWQVRLLDENKEPLTDYSAIKALKVIRP